MPIIITNEVYLGDSVANPGSRKRLDAEIPAKGRPHNQRRSFCEKRRNEDNSICADESISNHSDASFFAKAVFPPKDWMSRSLPFFVCFFSFGLTMAVTLKYFFE